MLLRLALSLSLLASVQGRLRCESEPAEAWKATVEMAHARTGTFLSVKMRTPGIRVTLRART